jgi:alpha-beta hydrolase superfamily lysophospholipase
MTGDRLRRSATIHTDGTLMASDGQAISYRTTVPPGKPAAVVVMQQGTLGKPEYFDQMGEALAQNGIKSYAVGSRTEAPNFKQHATDLDAVVKLARHENPGARVTVMGVSLGSMIALDWSARFNPTHAPVVAMSPVVMNKFLGPGDTLKVAAGFVSESAARWPVNTPMSKHVPLTTDPASPEAHLTRPETMKVPAGLFDDVGKMTADIAWHGRRMQGPLLVSLAGSDGVAINGATQAFTHLIGAQDKQVVTIEGAAHDLSQEVNHADWVQTLSSWVLKHARP